MKNIIILFLFIITPTSCSSKPRIVPHNAAKNFLIINTNGYDTHYIFNKNIYEQWVKQGDICQEYGHVLNVGKCKVCNKGQSNIIKQVKGR